MCLNCGCGELDNDMGNPDNLTLTDLAKAAKASELNGANTIANIQKALAELDAKQLDQKIEGLA
jgi:hypothetical protein